jgi:hypothetical protein
VTATNFGMSDFREFVHTNSIIYRADTPVHCGDNGEDSWLTCQPQVPEHILRVKMAHKPRPKDDRDQRERFIEAARKAGASENEADFDKALKKVAKSKPETKKQSK